MPTYTGCDDVQKIRLETVRGWSKQCITNALDMSYKKNDKFNKEMGKYFSGLGAAGGWGNVTSLVMKTINSMKLTIDSGMYEIAVISNQPVTKATTNEACASWQQTQAAVGRMQGTMSYNGQTMNVVEAQMDFAVRNGPSRMSIYPLFFKLPFYVEDGQSQVQSFLHELSHCAAGTIDVNAPSCYGMPGVRNCMRNGTSAMNAENVAMFLAKFA